MINILIESIVLEKQYEFRLDENIRISDLAEEITEMICQRERCKMNGSGRDLVLYGKNPARLLSGDATLASCGIHTGDLLYFA